MNNNSYLNLSEAAKSSPGHPHKATVWRWCRRGVKARSGERIRLEHVRAGGKIFVPADALEKFFKDVADADAKHFADKPATQQVPAPTAAQRERSIQQAEHTLQRAGILTGEERESGAMSRIK